MADHEDNGAYNPELYVKYCWTPPPWKIPLEITRRMHSFKEAVKKTCEAQSEYWQPAPSSKEGA
jgi:hypothetical protein